ncbi:hypothetical protein [Aquibacillus albus]|uniref:Uncharacterized protein n=1 Tax=Aquibacillus albus TaxID=1168171 RepID=A0ABS2N040_9BACI|nr:hypothetical protein [Aquibacillus albus]MBM7571524.1 hypothetical protein [Aquibacillus albus]
MSSKKENQERLHPFDQMMLGPRGNNQTPRSSEKDSNRSTNIEEEFDLFGTAQTVAETYKQLSPYMKGIKNAIKKFKS